jgi:two-component system cell cycle sensor histidine kinase/response regulator CckA
MASIASRQGASERQNRVLIAAANDLETELGGSLLWREDIERVFVSELQRVPEAVRDHQPNVLVIDAVDPEAAAEIIRVCRQDSETRRTGIVALNRGEADEHDALRAAGANLVLSVPVDPALWDGPIAALLRVPPRRDLRVPVMLEAWSTTRRGEALVEGVALNISVRGILLEAAQPLDAGTKFDLSFSLPDGPGELRAVGQVVRRADGDTHLLYGIQFLVLQGEARDRIVRFVTAAAPSLLGGAPRKVLTFRQSVERREWEAELRASEARNAAILASVLEAIVISGHEGRIVEFNPSAEATFGWSRAEAVGTRLEEILPGFKQAGFRQRAFSAGEGCSLGQRVETVGRRSDGSEFPAELAVTRVVLEGPPLFALCLRDTTERKRAESVQAQATAQFHALFERAADAMVVADNEGRYVEVNAAACALYGVERRELLGRWIGDLAGPEFDFRRILAAPRGSSIGNDLRVPRPDGSVREVELAATPDFLPGSHLVVLRDQTERRALEAQYRQAQKMEAVGRLAGGVAHDFNNLLGVIGGYADLLLRKLAPDTAERRKAEHIRDASNRAAGLTQKLLAFSRKQLLQPRVVNLNAVVSGVATMLTRVIREDIELRMDLDGQLGSLKADSGQLEQVLMNLAINARDAMPDGGQILIETRNVDLLDSTESESLGARPGPYVRLRFSDTGSGMDAETRRHIFEPFFTTKEPGQGTGLGLSTVFGVVAQSDGHIAVDSELGHGTTFTIYLPRIEGELDAAGSHEAKRPVGGHETVLVVEDEPMLRSLTRELLAEAGYRVLDAENGDAALRIAGAHPGPIDLLVTDVVMPGMSGLELARQLCASRPHTRVVYCSGYTEDAVVRSGRVGPGSAFLPKPFAPADLERLVRQVLDAPQAKT